jgi:hypothetical protein
MVATTTMRRVESETNHESISKWFEEDVGNGENSILVYPSLQSFRQIYTHYAKDKQIKDKEEEGSDDVIIMTIIVIISTKN